MKIRIMSNYDIAKNLINIINNYAEYACRNKNNASAVAQKVLNNSDVFVKNSEKGIRK